MNTRRVPSAEHVGMDGGPFRGSAAISRGELTRHGLRTRFQRIYRDVYLSDDVELTAAVRARAAWLSTGATLGGISAAAIHRTKWLSADLPAEIIRDDRCGQPGLVAHSWQLRPDEICTVSGMPVTTPARTAFDIGRLHPAGRAIPLLDALMNVTGLKAPDVAALADDQAGLRGIRLLREVLKLADGGAESPQETRLRLLLVGSGLPKPETQIEFPQLRIRVDMGWREWKVAVEYDGVQHWENRYQRSWDIERIALLETAGWIVIRVSAEMLSRPDALIARVKGKLHERGCRL